MNRLDALRYFCLASETLSFRETATRLAISPSVVTRVIAELEDELGEQLFKRNTRTIRLTSFGEHFLLEARQYLADGERLFALGKQKHDDDEMAGIVRITVPNIKEKDEILAQLLEELKAYPKLIIDWRVGMNKLDSVAHRIDIGLRVGRTPNDNFIVRHIANSRAIFVASPKLIERLGMPKDIDDMARNFPFTGLLNTQTGRIWELRLDKETLFTPRHVVFISDDISGEMQAVLAGQAISQLSTLSCASYLKTGEMVVVLPELELETWSFYLYRPYQTITPKRVLRVFDILTDILRKQFNQ